MYTKNQLENILFLDIETASITATYNELPERIKEHWDKKSAILNRREVSEMDPEELYPLKAAIFSEFGKVVCISCGYIRFVGDEPTIRMKSYSGPDEKVLLNDFTQMVDQFMSRPERNLCAHNGKEFDYPYLGRRYLINRLPIPKALQIQGLKPWEVRLLDTMTIWKFGDYKSFTSLDLLTAILDVPSPKDDIDGSQVGRVFWDDKDYEKIKVYCEKDVVATAQVMLRFSGQPLIKEGAVESK